MLTLTSADRAAYLRARQLLDLVGAHIENAAAEFVQAKRLLGEVPLFQAAEYYLKRHPARIEPRSVTVVMEEMLKLKQSDNLSEGYLKHLRYDLEKFAAAFHGNIGKVMGPDIDKWLRGLGVSPRTRNNLRTSVQTLFAFAKSQKYLPKDHDEIDAVTRVKDGAGEIEIFTPEEMMGILSHADQRVIPFLALGAFAGIRHAEIQRLDWRDIHFDAGIVEVRAAKAKTASRGTVPLLDNLRAWLLPQLQPGGPVCVYRNMASEINRLVGNISKARKKDGEKRAAFMWKHNVLRHSFISYRVAEIQNVAHVALEAGNSPQMIFKHYRELVQPKAAKAWFAIVPNR